MTIVKFLMGLTKEKELAFAEFGITKRNYHNEFSACFNTVNVMLLDEDKREEAAKDLLDCYEKEDLYDLCEKYDCSPSKLWEECLNSEEWTNEDLFDIDTNLGEIELGDKEIAFIFSACGQHDVRECGGFLWQVNEELNNKVLELWDKYHLKSVSDDVVKVVEELIKEAKEIDDYSISEQYAMELYS